jgi:SPP1 family predicted phage head-tail adaptor
VEAGKLRHRVTIEAPSEGQDAYGEPASTWTPVTQVWASREDLTGREAYAAQQVRAEVTTRFGMRFRDGITAKMRLLSDGIAYNVASVADPDGRKRTLVVMAAREG